MELESCSRGWKVRERHNKKKERASGLSGSSIRRHPRGRTEEDENQGKRGCPPRYRRLRPTTIGGRWLSHSLSVQGTTKKKLGGT